MPVSFKFRPRVTIVHLGSTITEMIGNFIETYAQTINIIESTNELAVALFIRD